MLAEHTPAILLTIVFVVSAVVAWNHGNGASVTAFMVLSGVIINGMLSHYSRLALERKVEQEAEALAKKLEREARVVVAKVEEVVVGAILPAVVAPKPVAANVESTGVVGSSGVPRR